MPPKPRPIAKPNTPVLPSVGTNLKEEDAAKAMPPPPNPPQPVRILEPEMNALSSCLKNAVIKTGQIYKFYSDTHKLGLHQYAPSPPHTLTASLGREIEKYDQLCDAIEAQLLRAVSVLQRDLSREERLAREAEAAAAASRAASAMLSPAFPPASVPPESLESTQPQGPSPPRPSPSSSTANPMSRRPSNISISSLHRTPFPLKLDLSSSALRTAPEETSLFSGGLASPINLAPNSAQTAGPPEFNAELMAAFTSSAPDAVDRPVTIDLTLPDSDDSAVGSQELANIGNSADKPIELDLDTMDIDMAVADLFGDAAEPSANDDLFSPPNGIQGVDDTINPIKSEDAIDIEILDAINAAGSSEHENIFGPFAGDNVGEDSQTSQNNEGSNGSSSLQNQAGQSPGSMLASFQAAATDLEGLNQQAISDGQNTSVSDNGFDFSGFFASTQDAELNPAMDFNVFFSNMGQNGASQNMQTEEGTKQ